MKAKKVLHIKAKQYVVGLAFTTEGNVVLIRKTRPDWQRGKLNGVGGCVKEGESPHDAMIREFREEACVDVKDWQLFCVLSGLGKEGPYECYCFAALKPVNGAHAPIDDPSAEQIEIWKRTQLPEAVIPNLHWLVPMAWNERMNVEHVRAEVTY